MLLGLLLTMALSSPVPAAPKLLRCATACINDGDDNYTCWYWEKPTCGRREFVCVDGPNVSCEPTSVHLGWQ